MNETFATDLQPPMARSSGAYPSTDYEENGDEIVSYCTCQSCGKPSCEYRLIAQPCNGLYDGNILVITLRVHVCCVPGVQWNDHST